MNLKYIGIRGDESKSYEIMTCKEYNNRQQRKYNEAVEEWRKENSYNIIPQIVFYFFWTACKKLRENGYVAIWQNSHLWFRTKKEVEPEIKRRIGLLN